VLIDFGYTLRSFLRSPGFTLAAILSLALGIGANTAMFSLVNAVLLRRLPVREPDRLVNFSFRTPTPERFGGNSISRDIYAGIRDKNTVLEGFAAINGRAVILSDANGAERVEGSAVSSNFFQTLGVAAIVGRMPSAQDGDQVCAISYRLWQTRFHGDPGVIGRQILIDGQPLTILGVAPKQFHSVHQGDYIDVAYPLAMAARNAGLRTFGRLKPGVTIEQAQFEIDALYHQIQTSRQPGILASIADTRVILEPGGQGFAEIREQFGRPLLMLMAVVGSVLLITCANLANLATVRALRRTKEMAVRVTVGAERRHLVGQILTETALLTTVGALFSLAVAYWIDHSLIALAPRQWGGSELIVGVQPDWRVLLFMLGVTLAVSLLSGALPAIQTTQLNPTSAISGATGIRKLGRFSPSDLLVVLQVALAFTLLIGAGLFLRSLQNLRSIDPGFDPDKLIVLTIDATHSGLPLARTKELFDSVVERARMLPGVVRVSPGVISPLSGDYLIGGIRVPGYIPRPHERDAIAFTFVGPEYFTTLGTPLIEGRLFNDQDGASSKAAIINEKTAAHYWPGMSAIGQRLGIGGCQGECTIVGIVKSEKTESLREDAPPIVYLPFRANIRPFMALHVRVAGNTTPVIAALVREVHSIDRNLPVRDVTTMATQIDRTLALDRLMALLTTLFGILGVALAAVGLYGVVAFSVNTRTREIGIRMALGATRGNVLFQFLRESGLLIAIGLAVGLLGALLTSRALASQLYNVRATDPLIYIVLAVALSTAALAATSIPARRASKVDPMVALRHE
jgi:predicted permease